MAYETRIIFSATGWSLVQRISPECLLCVLECDWM